ncbi:hypothetical protein RM550_26155 [Streptomyces sp. DSM 41527]|uniref:Uncharacterized protein n=1 Tax=Streptomyces mooreae TaxID=3075523 RepID=A0ABU2TDZ4_9ACTN|nr:hypothetical protein [Streptomyces sp. DSM 41527]MDT0459158.1 hypothetical protein [Streptomyces sp. DSM 41527]
MQRATGTVTTLRQTWLAEGRVDVPPEAIDPELWDDLASESDRCEKVAVVRHNQRPGMLVMRDGSITSPQRCLVHPGGSALNALARSKVLADIASEATGLAHLTPIRFGFKYYSPDDYMHAHLDDGKCDITFSTGLTPNLGPMGWLPNLRHLTPQQVADRLGDTPYPQGGEEFPIWHRRLSGFDGRRIPHWRPPLDSPSREVLITVCFSDLSV